MTTALGRVLTWHRSLCPRCTPTYACPEYREITEEYTIPRRIYAGPVAPCTRLDVREAT
jgi:hypothetical protein